MILIIFTKSYPYDFAAEHTFLEREIPHLVRNFDRVLLVPRTAMGNLLTIPSNVEIERGLADYYRENAGIVSTTFNALGSPSFRQGLRSKLHLLSQPFKLAKLILFSGRVTLFVKWFNNWLENHPAFDGQIMLYTYWFDEITTGLSLVKQKHPQFRLISRAHGFDIYEEEYFPYYWPLRPETLALMDKLFLASSDGRDYFRNRYPEFSNLFETAHLGTEDPGFISNASTDNVFRIVSCAHILPLKRIDLLSEGVAVAAKKRPKQMFEWHHFGEGKGRKALQKAIDTLFPPNAIGHFPGYVPNHSVIKHYIDKPVDVFVNVSSTEGLPISIQEAISFGIPIIATAVGGNSEIVSEQNGLLLHPNPTPEEIAQALLKICDNQEMARKMRQESRRVWEESYNAEVNFRAFAKRLKAIREAE